MNTKTKSKSSRRTVRGSCAPHTHTIMKTRLNKIIERITNLRDHAEDDEFRDELDNALIHLDAASDRLIAIDEEEDEES